MVEGNNRWRLVLVVWVGVVVLACPCIGTETPQPTATPPEPDAAGETGAVPTAPEAMSRAEVLADLPEEQRIAVVRYRLGIICDEPPPVELPTAEVDLSTDGCHVVCLWGFPFGEGVHVELYDPSGQLVAARDETRERGWSDLGLKEIQVSLAGWPAGDWVITADSAGMSLRMPLHVGEPEHPVMSIALEEADPLTTSDDCAEGSYARGDQIVLFGAGLPPSRTLPLGVYEGRGYVEAWHVYSLVYRQEVRTDDHGRFEVHQAVRALAPEGGAGYLATVPLDPVAPNAYFRVKTLNGTPSGAVILDLAVDGGPFVDPRVQRAVLATANRPHLSERFGATQVTFLFSFRGSAMDASAEPWDPDLARQLLAEAGYADGVAAEFIYPDGDVEVAAVVQDMARDLARVGISAEIAAVSPADVRSYFETRAMAGMPVLWLVRR